MPDTQQFEPVGFVSGNEPWVDVTLADGTKIQVRNVIVSIQMVKGSFGPDGTPTVQVTSANVVRAALPVSMSRASQSN